jgi:hypothetical protein
MRISLVFALACATSVSLTAQSTDPIRRLRFQYAAPLEHCYVTKYDAVLQQDCFIGITEDDRGVLLGRAIIASDSTYVHLGLSWKDSASAARRRFDAMSRDLRTAYGVPRTCGAREQLWTKRGWWARLRSYESGRRLPTSAAVMWSTELQAATRTRKMPAECIAELQARLDLPESWPMPAAGARLLPLDPRVPALEQKVRGCYGVALWDADESVHFTPPALLRLNDTVTNHNRFSRTLRLRPDSGLDEAHWEVYLPNRVRLEWIEPAPGVIHGGVYAELTMQGDTLRGHAERFRDVSYGQRGATLVLVRRACE